MAGSIVVGLLSAGAAVNQRKSSKAQLKSQKEEGKIQRRVADVENQRRTRRAIANRRIQQAEIISQSQVSGQTGANSAVTGAVGSLTTQTAANVGAANTRLAGQTARYSALYNGARRAAGYNNLAAGFSAAAGIAGTAAGQAGINKAYKKATG